MCYNVVVLFFCIINSSDFRLHQCLIKMETNRHTKIDLANLHSSEFKGLVIYVDNIYLGCLNLSTILECEKDNVQ